MSRSGGSSRALRSGFSRAAFVCLVTALTASNLTGTAVSAPQKAPAIASTKTVATTAQALKRVVAAAMPVAEPLKDALWPAAGEAEVVLPKTTALPPQGRPGRTRGDHGPACR